MFAEQGFDPAPTVQPILVVEELAAVSGDPEKPEVASTLTCPYAKPPVP